MVSYKTVIFPTVVTETTQKT